MSNSYFQSDLLSEFDRLHQQVASLFGGFPYSVRSDRYGAFPQLNVGSTDDTVEIVAFVPGVQADQLNVSIDKGVLTISGERAPAFGEDEGDESRRYRQERFTGAFRRIIELPAAADPDKVSARYVNGCLTISVGKAEASKPRAITVQ